MRPLNKYNSVHSRINSNQNTKQMQMSIDMSNIHAPDLNQHRGSMPSIEDSEQIYNAYKIKNIKRQVYDPHNKLTIEG